MQFRLFLPVFIASTIVSCVQVTDKSPVPQAETNRKNVDQEKLFTGATLSCAKPTDCPSGVGMVVGKVGPRVKTCTGTLVSPTTVVTSRECVSPELLAGASCAGKISVTFAASETAPAERIDCHQIAYKPRRELTQGREYAVLTLSAPARHAPAPISREGVPDQMSLKMYSVVPSASGAATLVADTCVSDQASILELSYVQPYYQVITASNCRVPVGGLGSAMVDERGQVRAIVQDVPLGQTVRATNSACLMLQADHRGEMNPGCEQQTNVNARLDALLKKNANSPIERDMVDWMKTNSQVYSWSLERIAAGIYAPQPVCIKDPANWPSRVHFAATTTETSESAPDLVSKWAVPRWRVVPTVNPALHLAAETFAMGSTDMTLSVHGHFFRPGEPVEVKAKLGEAPEEIQKLEVCPAD